VESPPPNRSGRQLEIRITPDTAGFSIEKAPGPVLHMDLHSLVGVVDHLKQALGLLGDALRPGRSPGRSPTPRRPPNATSHGGLVHDHGPATDSDRLEDRHRPHGGRPGGRPGAWPVGQPAAGPGCRSGGRPGARHGGRLGRLVTAPATISPPNCADPVPQRPAPHSVWGVHHPPRSGRRPVYVTQVVGKEEERTIAVIEAQNGSGFAHPLCRSMAR